MNRADLAGLLGRTLHAPSPTLVPGAAHRSGKVRDIWDLGDELLIMVSDRVSAFDRVLTTLPCKGEVLNRTALFWFDETRDIIANHVLERPSPRSMLARKCSVVPIEVVVRGYLAGSAWRDYAKGAPVSGIQLPAGMRENQRLEQPLLTPSTKEEQGHDRPISRREIVAKGLAAEALWRRIEEAALALFRRGTELLAARGLILVDTKYEFGTVGDELLLVDEIHTPDSSRFWYAADYHERFDRGESQRQLDKEYLRRWLMDHGFSGSGDAPEIPDEVRVETAFRYVEAFEVITGQRFAPAAGSAEDEASALSGWLRGRRARTR
jgi:phosphoribosylaminoimidazole-succinocarboxamide synthase